MLRKASMVFGVVFVALGLLGFVPALTPDGNLLGLFLVDGVHNVVHLLSGVAALAASTSAGYSRLYFQVFGVVYALVAILGFMMSPVLGFLVVDMADNWLHVVIAASALYLGFVFKDREVVATT